MVSLIALISLKPPPTPIEVFPQLRALAFEAPYNFDVFEPAFEPNAELSIGGRVGFTDGRLEYGCRTGFGGGHRR
ncbi:hypothetical protein AYI70_g2985 [Smittium culicis]|uniref:Uncharacterized protein n=1 Tax=Smittium culicis TaxID=133412 RepID=A0A1R1Y5T6_9FUNG|nr:hypothetical protein AYI70_g2985 [Smittium culicis]